MRPQPPLLIVALRGKYPRNRASAIDISRALTKEIAKVQR